MSTKPLELDDIQGNVLAGFNTNVEVFVGLTADPTMTGRAANWLAELAPRITSVATVKREREAKKAPLRGAIEFLPSAWRGVAIGPELLKLIRPDVVFEDAAFVRGFTKRAPSGLGDRSDPNGWRVNGPSGRVDVLLNVASNVESVATSDVDELLRSASSAGLALAYRETARRIRDLEHFGFRDGISQPKVQGFDETGDITAGHFVFGYSRFADEPSFLPGTDPGGYMQNGSFMVFRRLAQDVKAFRDFCAQRAVELSAQLPGLTPSHLAALLVGRWPSGALATMQVPQDPGIDMDENAFDFADDPAGRNCPFGAHIRKVNPRAGPKDVVDVPRILRRGVPFGPTYEVDPTAERGLAFVSFQTSIVDQLELLTSNWMNSPLRPAPRAGHDLLVGRARSERSLELPGPTGPVLLSDGGRQWIQPTGGAYLFAPSKSALSRIADPLASGVAWRVQRLMSNTKSVMKELVGF